MVYIIMMMMTTLSSLFRASNAEKIVCASTKRERVEVAKLVGDGILIYHDMLY
jgi:hypothetical protein